MEITGLAVGIPGLFSACMDTLERIEAYKDFGIESRQLIAQFEAEKLRLKKWAIGVGISNGKWTEMHDPRLKERDIELVVKRILSSACEIFDAAERTRSQLRIDAEETNKTLPDIPGFSIEMTKNKEKSSVPMSIRGGLGWAFKRRGKFTNQIDQFRQLVDLLYSLVPIKTDIEPRISRRASSLVDHVNDESSQNQSASASFQKAIQSLLEDTRRLAWQQAKMAINDWLDITRFDEQYNVSHHYEKQILSRLQGTCEWIFSKPAYCTWASEDLSDRKAKFLWICGPPGYGKTMLCARLVEHFKEKLGFPIAYFFSTAHAQSGGQPSAIVRSWIGQIARADPDALDLVRGFCDRSEAGRVALETEVWSVFESIIFQKPHYTFALDGFDEYARLDESRARFLRRLKKATEGTSTRILISSRDEIDIRSELLSESNQTAGPAILECKISREDVRDDITFYSRSVVDEKLPKKDEALRQDLAGQLAERCEGMFLWIKLQQDQLRGGKNRQQLQNIVKNMPTGLNQTYERNWKTIQSRTVDEQKRALAILRWATFALRPLTVSEMTEALIVETEDNSAHVQWDELPDIIDDEYINGEIIDICGCLVEARDEEAGDPVGLRTIHLIHPSVRDFLLSVLSPNPELILHHSLLSDQAADQSGQHNYLAQICLTYLNHDDIWKCDHKPTDLLPFIYYAKNYWHSHIDAAAKDDRQVIQLVNEFLCPENANFQLWRGNFESLWEGAGESSIQSKAVATPLYYAALFNLIPSMEYILENGSAQLNSVGGRYGTPLQAACVEGHSRAVHALIRGGADPNVQGGQSGVPLNAAIAGGHIDMVKSLVNIGASLELQDCQGRRPLYIASVNGYPAITAFLLEAGAKLETEQKDEWIPLNGAASKGHFEVVRLLLDRGAAIKCSDKNGWTSMHWAAYNDNVEVIELLLDRGADVMAPDKNGKTPMDLAAEAGHVEVVMLLLNRGADVGASYGVWAPLHSAALEGRLEVAKLLLDRGADIRASYSEWTPLHLAAASGHLQIVRLLLDRGADIMSSVDEGWAPIHLAANNNHLEVVKLLLDRGADVMVTDDDGWTSMHWAAYKGYVEVIKLLLEGWADVVTSDNDRRTPAELAAENGHVEALKLLLDRRADAMTSSERQTLMHLAIRRGHLEVVELLLNREGSISTPCQPLEEAPGLCIDVNAPSGPYGSILNTAAYMGQLKILQMFVETYNANIIVIDGLGRTPLHFAARGGDMDCVNYLLDGGLQCSDTDNFGNNVLHHACSGGSTEVVRKILELDSLTADSSTSWTPLHWACRTGGSELIQLLLSHGFHKSVVYTKYPPACWSPASIGFFHQNPSFDSDEQQSFIKELEVPHSSLKGSNSSTESPPDLRGTRQERYWCDGCLHWICGPRFHCQECEDFDFCFMCRLTSEKAHPGHSWQEHNIVEILSGDG